MDVPKRMLKFPNIHNDATEEFDDESLSRNKGTIIGVLKWPSIIERQKHNDLLGS